MSTKREEAEKIKDEGNGCISKGNREEAIRLYKKAQACDDTYAIAYLNCGRAYYGLERYEEAIKEFDMAIERDPTDASAYYYRGQTYKTIGNLKKASENIDLAIIQDNTYANAYWQRAFTSYREYLNRKITSLTSGDTSEGTSEEDVKKIIGDCDNAIKYGIEDVAYAEALIGSLYSEIGEYDKAVEHLNKSIKKSIDSGVEPHSTVYGDRFDAYFKMCNGEHTNAEMVGLLNNAFIACGEAIEVINKKNVKTEEEIARLKSLFADWNLLKKELDYYVELFKSAGLIF
jgi:tetratricopeptide (TPR) repeat protein